MTTRRQARLQAAADKAAVTPISSEEKEGIKTTTVASETAAAYLSNDMFHSSSSSNENNSSRVIAPTNLTTTEELKTNDLINNYSNEDNRNLHMNTDKTNDMLSIPSGSQKMQPAEGTLDIVTATTTTTNTTATKTTPSSQEYRNKMQIIHIASQNSSHKTAIALEKTSTDDVIPAVSNTETIERTNDKVSTKSTHSNLNKQSSLPQKPNETETSAILQTMREHTEARISLMSTVNSEDNANNVKQRRISAATDGSKPILASNSEVKHMSQPTMNGMLQQPVTEWKKISTSDSNGQREEPLLETRLVGGGPVKSLPPSGQEALGEKESIPTSLQQNSSLYASQLKTIQTHPIREKSNAKPKTSKVTLASAKIGGETNKPKASASMPKSMTMRPFSFQNPITMIRPTQVRQTTILPKTPKPKSAPVVHIQPPPTAIMPTAKLPPVPPVLATAKATILKPTSAGKLPKASINSAVQPILPIQQATKPGPLSASKTGSPRPSMKRKNTKRRVQKNRTNNSKPTMGSPRQLHDDKSGSHTPPVRLPIHDEDSSRVFNLLVDLPAIDPSEPPNSADLHVCSGIVFSRPDTFPLSYYARLLGFQVPETPKDRFVKLDTSTMVLRKDIPEVPSLGPKLPLLQKLDYHDPVYKALLRDTSESVADLKRASISQTQKRSLNCDCLQQAKEYMGDKLPEFFLWDGGDFGIATTDGHYIRYQFVWYQFQEHDTNHGKGQSFYGMPSMAHHVAKKKTAELILDVTAFGRSKDIVESRKKVSAAATAAAATSQSKGKIDADPKVGAVITISNPVGESKGEGVKSTVSGDSSTQPNTIKGKTEANTRESEVLQNGVSTAMQQGDNDARLAIDEKVIVVLMALVLEHARACDVFYGVVSASRKFARILQHSFRMCRMKTNAADGDERSTNTPRLLCDLKNSNSRLAFLSAQSTKTKIMKVPREELTRRMVVMLPSFDETRVALQKSVTPKRPLRTMPAVSIVNCPPVRRRTDIHIRLQNDVISYPGAASEALPQQPSNDALNWRVLRTFSPQIRMEQVQDNTNDEILNTMKDKIGQLVALEEGTEPALWRFLNALEDERVQFEKEVDKRLTEKKLMKDYELALERRKELDAAWQKQIDQDMNAVCAICNDGEVTPGNQILFCEACNVAVHQMCYGIENVPEGDYYCVACRFFGREKMSFTGADNVERIHHVGAPAPKLPINCELCPQQQGAFIRCQTTVLELSPTVVPINTRDGTTMSKWVHVVCAKWQGLNFVDKAKREVVEDVLPLKLTFRQHKVKCDLCQSSRGAFNKCRQSNCQKWLHVTCARAYGRCEVIHGENCEGPVSENPWTLLCTEHSNVKEEAVPQGSSTKSQLEACAKVLPPEILPDLNQKPNRFFVKMNGKERKSFLSDRRNETSLMSEILERRLQGVRCEVCNTLEEEGKNLTKCSTCGVVYCDSCRLPSDNENDSKVYSCKACEYRLDMETKGESFVEPHCAMCFQAGGWLRAATATPMKKWPSNKSREFAKTLFAKKLWAHTLCAMWQFPLVLTSETTLEVDLSNVIMTHGTGFVQEKSRCIVCGKKQGLKMKCTSSGCRGRGEKTKAPMMHLTCARQAGLEINNKSLDSGEIDFYARCHKHVSCEFAFRARLEDLIEMERRRAGKRLEYDARLMSISHASRLLNGAISILHVLGWSWRWAEWWVDDGSTWEPLIEPGEDESKMTKEQLKIIDSTPVSRCNDARKCRLAAFGAALRNRDYDKVEGGDTVILDRAFRAVLNTKSLVGPLEEYEIDFFAQWLGMAYRSKSRLLGFGIDKIKVDEKILVHEDDGSPKYELGKRRLPGSQSLAKGQVFESDVNEIDDFLKPEKLLDGTLFSEFEESRKKKEEERKASSARLSLETQKRSRPPQNTVHQEEGGIGSTNTEKKKKAERIKQPPKRQYEIIPDFAPTDVVLAVRGRAKVNDATDLYRSMYQELAISQTPIELVAAMIVEKIRSLNPPGRFLKKLKKDGAYMVEKEATVLSYITRSISDRRKHFYTCQRKPEHGGEARLAQNTKKGTAEDPEKQQRNKRQESIKKTIPKPQVSISRLNDSTERNELPNIESRIKEEAEEESESEHSKRRGPGRLKKTTTSPKNKVGPVLPPKEHRLQISSAGTSTPDRKQNISNHQQKSVVDGITQSSILDKKRRGPGRPRYESKKIINTVEPENRVIETPKKRGRPPRAKDEFAELQGKRRRSAPNRPNMVVLDAETDDTTPGSNGVGPRSRLKRKSAPVSFRDDFSISEDESLDDGEREAALHVRKVQRRRERPKSISNPVEDEGSSSTAANTVDPSPREDDKKSKIKVEGLLGNVPRKVVSTKTPKKIMPKKLHIAEEDDQPISTLVKSKKDGIETGTSVDGGTLAP